MPVHDNSLTIIAPCYNEGQTVIRFLDHLERVLSSVAVPCSVVIVNDCSDDDTAVLLRRFRFSSGRLSFAVINLERNVGHQAAIYQGLLYARTLRAGRFIIMDADGEDDPSAITGLLKYADADMVTVVRSHRRESGFFRFCYGVYKGVFKLVTGKQMNFGNFCMISSKIADRAVEENFQHLAAFLCRQPEPMRYISAPKEERLGGRSKMTYGKLLRHAARSFTEYYHKGAERSSAPIYELYTDGHT